VGARGAAGCGCASRGGDEEQTLAGQDRGPLAVRISVVSDVSARPRAACWRVQVMRSSEGPAAKARTGTKSVIISVWNSGKQM
jgi:hypothetical protein